jgi:hypothetical protein
MGEMVERGETKFEWKFHKNTQLIEIIKLFNYESYYKNLTCTSHQSPDVQMSAQESANILQCSKTWLKKQTKMKHKI